MWLNGSRSGCCAPEVLAPFPARFELPYLDSAVYVHVYVHVARPLLNMQSQSKHTYLSHDVGDVIPIQQGGQEVTAVPLRTEKEWKDHSVQNKTQSRKTKWLQATKWLPLALLFYFFISWAHLGSNYHPFQYIQEIPSRLAGWHFSISSTNSNVTCPYFEFLPFRAWLTV